MKHNPLHCMRIHPSCTFHFTYGLSSIPSTMLLVIFTHWLRWSMFYFVFELFRVFIYIFLLLMVVGSFIVYIWWMIKHFRWSIMHMERLKQMRSKRNSIECSNVCRKFVAAWKLETKWLCIWITNYGECFKIIVALFIRMNAFNSCTAYYYARLFSGNCCVCVCVSLTLYFDLRKFNINQVRYMVVILTCLMVWP